MSVMRSIAVCPMGSGGGSVGSGSSGGGACCSGSVMSIGGGGAVGLGVGRGCVGGRGACGGVSPSVSWLGGCGAFGVGCGVGCIGGFVEEGGCGGCGGFMGFVACCGLNISVVVVWFNPITADSLGKRFSVAFTKFSVDNPVTLISVKLLLLAFTNDKLLKPCKSSEPVRLRFCRFSTVTRRSSSVRVNGLSPALQPKKFQSEGKVVMFVPVTSVAFKPFWRIIRLIISISAALK